MFLLVLLATVYVLLVFLLFLLLLLVLLVCGQLHEVEGGSRARGALEGGEPDPGRPAVRSAG